VEEDKEKEKKKEKEKRENFDDMKYMSGITL
jgi:hypothetical protein